MTSDAGPGWKHPQPTARSAPLNRARRGQGLVELAITLPILLLLLGGALDLGRAFFARIAIENAAKEGAFFGATAPRCDTAKTACLDPRNVEWHVRNEAPGLSVTISAECLRNGSPVALSSCAEDDTYRVTVGHTFTMVTPILSPLIGATLDLSAVAESRVFNPALTPGSPLPLPTGSSSASPSPSAGACMVPNFDGVKKNSATGLWTAAGFSGANISFQAGNGNYTIDFQSVAAGTVGPCATTSIQVGP